MTDLLELLDNIDYFFEPIQCITNPELSYECYLKEGRWNIETKGREGTFFFGTTSNEEVIDHLTRNNADLIEFEDLVRNCVINHGVYLRMQLRKVEKLVGSEVITQQEESWNNFVNELSGIIKKETGPKLEIV